MKAKNSLLILIVITILSISVISADVGIYQNSGGKPTVSCPSGINIISGQQKDITVRVDGSGSFQYQINCDKGSQVANPMPPILGGTDIDIRVSLTVAQGTEVATCTFTAENMHTFEKDSCSFAYSSTHDSGQQRSIENNILQNGDNSGLYVMIGALIFIILIFIILLLTRKKK